MREARGGHKVPVTTRLDDRQVGKDDFSALYTRRWNVELDLRNLKTTTAGPGGSTRWDGAVPPYT